MTAATPSRLGTIKQDTTAANLKNLFMKVFSGEVMATYNAETVMKDRVRTRSITSGKSASFAAIGKIDASYHTPGDELLGQKVDHNEVVISINNLLVSHAFISNIDEAMNHYDVRSEYTKQMGQALAQTFDRDLLSTAWDQAGTDLTGTVNGMGISSKIVINPTPTADQLVTAFYSAAQKFDEDNLPESGRYIVVSPEVYYKLLSVEDLIDRDMSGGNGNFAGARLGSIAGMPILKSNNIGQNRTITTDLYNKTSTVDGSNQLAMVMHKDAMGVVQLMDVSSESEYDIRRQGTLMLSKMAVGFGVLRPEGIIALAKA